MEKNQFPSLIADYDEMKLAEWSARPVQRKSHTVQRARWSWRVIRNLMIAFFGINTAVAFILALARLEQFFEYQSYASFYGLLLLLSAMIQPEAPEWWVEAYRKWC